MILPHNNTGAGKRPLCFFVLAILRIFVYTIIYITLIQKVRDGSMAKNDEYDSLCRERDRTQRAYSNSEQKIEDYDYLLGRLRPVKNTVSDLKDRFRDIKKADEKLLDEKREWTGQKYSDFLVKGQDVEGCNSYYHKYVLDHVLDALNDEITRIENLRLEEYGLLGRLGAKLNSLGNAIENFFN